MNQNSNGMSTGMAIVCTIGIMLFIGLIIDLNTPKCIKSGCDNDAKGGSSYCYLHDDSSYRYKGSRTTYSGSTSSSGSSSSAKSSSTSSSAKNSGNSSSSKKTYSSGSSANRSSKKKSSSTIRMMMAIMPFMKMMITTGTAIGAMMTMLPEWMMRWRMKNGKNSNNTFG